MSEQAATAGIEVPETKEPAGSADRKAETGRKERLALLRVREGSLRKELDAARVEESRAVEAVETCRQALAAGEGTTADVGKARRAAEEIRTTVGDLEAALAEVSGKREALATEIAEVDRERERQRQEKAAAALHEEADAAVAAFIEAAAGVSDHLRRRQEIAGEIAAKYPLAGAVPLLKFDELLRKLQERMDERRTDDPLAYRSFLIRVLAGPTGVPWLPVPLQPVDRLRKLGIEL